MAIEKAASGLWKIVRDQHGRRIMVGVIPISNEEVNEDKDKAKEEIKLKKRGRKPKKRNPVLRRKERRLEKARLKEDRRQIQGKQAESSKPKKSGRSKKSSKSKKKEVAPSAGGKYARAKFPITALSLWRAQGGFCDGHGRSKK